MFVLLPLLRLPWQFSDFLLGVVGLWWGAIAPWQFGFLFPVKEKMCRYPFSYWNVSVQGFGSMPPHSDIMGWLRLCSVIFLWGISSTTIKINEVTPICGSVFSVSVSLSTPVPQWLKWSKKVNFQFSDFEISLVSSQQITVTNTEQCPKKETVNQLACRSLF